ncbi:hypothetical protein BC332_01990 [Capsicum chinense]|nr:hypothetical protein BC332_01990 [Capsicum chinense]
MTCFNDRETSYPCLKIMESNQDSHVKPLNLKAHPLVIGAFPLVRMPLKTSLHLTEWSTETKDFMDNFLGKIVTEKVLHLKSSTYQNIVVASSPSRNGSLSGWRVLLSDFGEEHQNQDPFFALETRLVDLYLRNQHQIASEPSQILLQKWPSNLGLLVISALRSITINFISRCGSIRTRVGTSIGSNLPNYNMTIPSPFGDATEHMGSRTFEIEPFYGPVRC